MLRRPTSLELALKRSLDVGVAAGVLVGLAPLLGVLTALELVFHGWPPVFKQARAGHRGRVFTLYKFRTMNNARGSDGQLLPDADRITPFGRFLRASSLDELPELVNVLAGHMSLVGPRPLLARYLDRYTPEQRRRHDMRPGLTGWAQVNGRNAISWDERFALDLWYIDNWSLALDVEILLKTVGSVLGRHGIAAEGEATMPEFMGARLVEENRSGAA